MQTSTGVRELKTHLSHYLRRVQAGEIIIITDHGRPIGQIIPYHQTIEDRLAQLQTGGLIEWNGEHPDTDAPVAEAQGERTVADLLLEDRD